VHKVVGFHKAKAIRAKATDGVVREFRRQDISSVERLIRETIECDPLIDSLQRARLLEYTNVERINNTMQSGYFVVYVEDNDEVSGFAGIAGTTVIYMFVKPEKQRYGIGSMLLNCLEDHGVQNQGVQDGTIIYRVFSTQLAVPFYQYHGYAEHQRVFHHGLGVPVCRVEMSKVVC